ncbi:MAG: hypothetical protein RL676_65 [Pseudomonadota bacterium]|jgi:3-deoxy-D-manno-octulosonate 8-phosphate phosphatase (KDO 8-P phosphatase)
MHMTTTPRTLDDAVRRARGLQWMFFDVDGVLTDGGLFYGPHGETLKRFHVLDGHGLKELKSAGISIGILSGRQHEAVTTRARELGFDLVVQGNNQKGVVFDQLVIDHRLDPIHCGHMGDDTADMEVFARVGFAASVPNATSEVIAAAHWVSTRPGGSGAVRECCDFILRARA